MTTTTLRHTDFEHELVLHDGEAELINLMVPFVRAGAEAGDQVVVVGEPTFVRNMLAAVPGIPHIVAVPQADRERYPGRDLQKFQQVLSSLNARGARVRVVNQMPVMTILQWDEWRRYEAAANLALAPYRVWGTCAYDTGHLTPGMLEDLTTSHSHVSTSAGRRTSARFTELDDHIRGYLAHPPDPIEATKPLISLQDPSLPAARQVIRSLAATFGVAATDTDTALLAVTETVSNGSRHGKRPVALQVWTHDGRIVVAVHDTGAGPHPLVGLLPVPLDHESGRGMWILHQLLTDLHHRTDRHGYTVRFSIDAPRVPTATGASRADGRP